MRTNNPGIQFTSSYAYNKLHVTLRKIIKGESRPTYE